MKKTILLITLLLSCFCLLAQDQDNIKFKEQVYLKYKNDVNSYIKFYVLNKNKEIIFLRLDSIYPQNKITHKLYFYNEFTNKTIKVTPITKIRKLYLNGYNDFELKYDDINDNLIVIGKD